MRIEITYASFAAWHLPWQLIITTIGGMRLLSARSRTDYCSIRQFLTGIATTAQCASYWRIWLADGNAYERVLVGSVVHVLCVSRIG
jgi:hypothetical protein